MNIKMGTLFRLIFFKIVLFLDVLPNTFADRHLKQVHVLYRNGNRSPEYSYPKDLYNESVWPQGFDMLTQKGINQQYMLGKWLRNRYMEDLAFLEPMYIANDIIVHSTDSHRTVMSAQSNLAGLYPPTGRQIWNTDLLWQPVGIFTYPSDVDPVLRFQFPCPKRVSLIEEKSETQFEKFLAKNQKIIDFIVGNSGVEKNMYSLSKVADTLYCQHEENFTLPEWTKQKVDGWDSDYYHWLMMLLNFQDTVIFQDANPELKKLLGGSLVARIASNFSAAGLNMPSPKLFMYSAHNTEVAGLLSSLDCHNGMVIPPAACVIVELYQDKESNLFTVDVLYKNTTDKPPNRLRIGPSGNKCDEQCPLENFLKYATAVSPDDDYSRECKMHNHHKGPVEWNTGWLIFGVAIMMFILLAFTMCILTIITASKGPVYKPRSRLQPIDFHLLGTGLSESEDEAVFDN